MSSEMDDDELDDVLPRPLSESAAAATSLPLPSSLGSCLASLLLDIFCCVRWIFAARECLLLTTNFFLSYFFSCSLVLLYLLN